MSAARRSQPEPSEPNARGIRGAYGTSGVEGYYRAEGAEYRNPHETDVRATLADLLADHPPGRALDLACGSGEASLELRQLGWSDIVGIDPFTAAAYRRRTGLPCTEQRFEDLARDGLPDRFDLIVCSYALHLPDPARLPTLCWQLGQAAPRLLLISPNNRPEIGPEHGFELERATRHGRARGRLLRRRDPS